jgi:hypothetical protein
LAELELALAWQQEPVRLVRQALAQRVRVPQVPVLALLVWVLPVPAWLVRECRTR